MQEGDGEPAVDQGGGGGVGVGGDQGEELYIVVILEFGAVVVGLGRPLLVVVPQPLHRPIRPLHPLGMAVAPILPAQPIDTAVPARVTSVMFRESLTVSHESEREPDSGTEGEPKPDPDPVRV